MEKQFYYLKANPSCAERIHTEEEATGRDKFSRDRDRILFSKEFRRLGGKTQVFVNGFDDHVRNRLTHTLEVSQISQTISKALGLNCILAEAISLAHDVGHTPFGHTGERVLNFFTNNCDPKFSAKIEDQCELGFKHNWQGLKVVTSLEQISKDYKGLNLTNYTLWGILNHSSLKYKKCTHLNETMNSCSYLNNTKNCHLDNKEQSLSHYNQFREYENYNSWTLEGLIVGHADEIAQRHHDIEDGLLAGIINIKEFVKFFKVTFEGMLTEKETSLLNNLNTSNNATHYLHDFASLILSFYSNRLQKHSSIQLANLIEKYKIESLDDFCSKKEEIFIKEDIEGFVNFDAEFIEQDKKFQRFLYSKILNSHLAQSMDGKANYIIRKLISAYITNPCQLPDGTIKILINNYAGYLRKLKKMISPEILKMEDNGNPNEIRQIINNLSGVVNLEFKTTLIRTITDFIAGMTDSFAISQYKTLYGSDNSWHY